MFDSKGFLLFFNCIWVNFCLSVCLRLKKDLHQGSEELKILSLIFWTCHVIWIVHQVAGDMLQTLPWLCPRTLHTEDVWSCQGTTQTARSNYGRIHETQKAACSHGGTFHHTNQQIIPVTSKVLDSELWTDLKAMQNQMMAIKSVASLSSGDKRDATFFITWTNMHIQHSSKPDTFMVPGKTHFLLYSL